jgi:hypothetical protein
MISYGAGNERFVFTDLTATDKKTGLMWTRDADLSGGYMTWEKTINFIKKLNKQKYAGYTDWRLPTRWDLHELIDYAESLRHKDSSPKEVLNMVRFIDVRGFYYWSSTFTKYGNTVYTVDMRDYNLSSYNVRSNRIKSDDSSYIWPVRGEYNKNFIEKQKGEKTGRFIFFKLTVKDKKTGLMWTRNADLIEKKVTWKMAWDFISQLNNQKYAGYNDWTLPSESEFLTLVTYAESLGYKENFHKLFSEVGFKNVRPSGYWCATCYVGRGYPSINVNMYDGDPSHEKAYTYYVWPVRGRK